MQQQPPPQLMQQQQPSSQQQQQTSQQQQQQQQLSKPGQKRRFTEEREESQEAFQVRVHVMCNIFVTALSCVFQAMQTPCCKFESCLEHGHLLIWLVCSKK
jgi:hypothetical protein